MEGQTHYITEDLMKVSNVGRELAEDDELVTNALDTIVNLAPFLVLKIFGEAIDSPPRGRIK